MGRTAVELGRRDFASINPIVFADDTSLAFAVKKQRNLAAMLNEVHGFGAGYGRSNGGGIGQLDVAMVTMVFVGNAGADGRNLIARPLHRINRFAGLGRVEHAGAGEREAADGVGGGQIDCSDRWCRVIGDEQAPGGDIVGKSGRDQSGGGEEGKDKSMVHEGTQFC